MLAADPIKELTRWIAPDDLALIGLDDLRWLALAFARCAGYPSLEEMWTILDEPWRELKCDPNIPDGRVRVFYSHPVWLLNGLFIEQHAESLRARRQFTDWIADQCPRRVADVGGGFGSLARMIGAACPSALVDVIEPHPHPVAVARAKLTANVRYRTKLTGEYDILVATDVFEHVQDPLRLAAETATALRHGGHYLIANCFYPLVLCHLPNTFHFRHSWDRVLEVMGLDPAENVAYGRVFVRHGRLRLQPARRLERRSQFVWAVAKHLPGRLARFLMRQLL